MKTVSFPADAITSLASRGYCTLQIADLWVGKCQLKKFPARWFMRVSGYSPCIGNETGCLFLTRAGWKANRAKLRKAFETAIAGQYNRGKTWKDFCACADNHFNAIETCRVKRIEALRAKLVALESLTV